MTEDALYWYSVYPLHDSAVNHIIILKGEAHCGWVDLDYVVDCLVML